MEHGYWMCDVGDNLYNIIHKKKKKYYSPEGKK